MLPLLFKASPSPRCGAYEFSIPLTRMGVLDAPLAAVSTSGGQCEGIEILESIRVSPGIREIGERWNRSGCFTWRHVVKRALECGANANARFVITAEREEEVDRCEGVHCSAFLQLQAKMIIEGIGKTTLSAKGLLMRCKSRETLCTLRRLLNSLGVRSKRPLTLKTTRVGQSRSIFYELYFYPVDGVSEATEKGNGEQEVGPGQVIRIDSKKRVNHRRLCRRMAADSIAVVQFDTRGPLLLDGSVYLPSNGDDIVAEEQTGDGLVLDDNGRGYLFLPGNQTNAK